MEQGLGDHIKFREVDQDGRPVDPSAVLQADEARRPEDPNRAAVNPYIAVLWVLTAVLTAGGLWVFTNAASFMGPTSGPMPLAYMLLNFAPWAVLAGILNALALLFWHAFHWQRKRL